MKISTTNIVKSATLGAFVAVTMASSAMAAQSSCKGAMCAIPVIPGAKCALSAYTNAAFTWTMAISNNPDGSDPFNTQEGAGENDTPMKWTSGNAVFKPGGEYVYISFTANGGTKLKMMTGSGFAEGTSSAIMNGEDGQDNDFNDVIANVTCVE